MLIDEKQIRDFLSFLDPHEKYFMFCFLDAASKGVIGGSGTVFCSVDEAIEKLHSLSDSGIEATLHVTLNRTKHTGRRKADITGSRVLCLDLDNLATSEDGLRRSIPFKPQIAIQSSIGKYHLYWRLAPGLALETWSKYQLALSEYFDGDEHLNDITKTIRVPGVERLAKDGTLVMPAQLVEYGNSPTSVTLAGLQKLFPWCDEFYEKALARKKTEQKRLARELRKLERSGDIGPISAGTTGRNTYLYSACYKKGLRLLRGNSEGIVTEILFTELQLFSEKVNKGFDAASEGPLDSIEVDKTLRSAWERAVEKFEETKGMRMEGLEVIGDGIEVVGTVNGHGDSESLLGGFRYYYSKGALKTSRFSTAGTVERILQRFGSHMIRTGALVYAFNPHELIWQAQKGSMPVISEYVQMCVSDIGDDPAFAITYMDKTRAALEKFNGYAFLHGVKAELISKLAIRTGSISDFDANSDLLFTGGEILDLRTGDCKVPEPEDMMLHHSDVLVVDERCPRWEAFVREVFSENDEPAKMVQFIQELFGYSLTGSIAAQKVFIHYGGGCNGKSKVLHALDRLMGSYATIMSCSTLSKSKGSFQKEFDRIGAKVEGKRVVIIDDLDTKTQWNEGTVKALTGGKIAARRLYEEERDIPNRAKFHVGCNDRPEPESENDGILRRMCIIHYKRKFKQSDAKENELMAMIESEISGILAWAVRGLHRYRARKGGEFDYPTEVLAALEDYRTENFTIETAIEELFRKPTQEEIAKDGITSFWHSTRELEQHLNTRLHGESVNAVELGRKLSLLKFEGDTKRKHGSRERGYFVVLQFDAEKEVAAELLVQIRG